MQSNSRSLWRKMTQKANQSSKKRGRPSTKIKLKPRPMRSAEDYYKRYGYLGVCSIYGLDEFTENLIEYLWNHPEMMLVCTDPNESRLSNKNREMGQRSFSMYRWMIRSYKGFIQNPMSDVIVVSNNHIADVKKMDNPHNVKFIVLEEI